MLDPLRIRGVILRVGAERFCGWVKNLESSLGESNPHPAATPPLSLLSCCAPLPPLYPLLVRPLSYIGGGNHGEGRPHGTAEHQPLAVASSALTSTCKRTEPDGAAAMPPVLRSRGSGPPGDQKSDRSRPLRRAWLRAKDAWCREELNGRRGEPNVHRTRRRCLPRPRRARDVERARHGREREERGA